jgi:hypothetical protein
MSARGSVGSAITRTQRLSDLSAVTRTEEQWLVSRSMSAIENSRRRCDYHQVEVGEVESTVEFARRREGLAIPRSVDKVS